LLCDRLDKTTFRNRLPTGDTRLHAREVEVAPFLGTACFATHTVVPQEALVTVAAEVPFEALAAVGCAVVTGVGAVSNAAKVPAGSVVAVIGAGGVGVNVVQGARLAGARRVIVVDREAAPLSVARALGATDVVTPTGKTADAIRELTDGRGADFVFDTVGTAATLTDAILSARKGGTIVVTGLARLDTQGSVRLYPFVMHEKRLVGSVYGSGDPLKDIGHLVGLYQGGQLKLDELATRTYALDQINEALSALGRGEGGRGVILA
jgi:S-(hydroxymethyl)glutathione dehydrogenase/alcohol dehydrogenase